MASKKVPVGEPAVTSGSYSTEGSRSGDRDVFPFSPGLAGNRNPFHSLEGKMNQLISKFKQLHATVGTVKELESHFQPIEGAIQDQNRRLGDIDTKLDGLNTKVEHLDNRINGLESRLDAQKYTLELQNTKLKNEVRELKSHISSLSEREEMMAKLVESAFMQEEPSVEEAVNFLPSARRLGMNNLVCKLVATLTNALQVANCIAIFQLASLCKLDELVVASVDTICKNFIQVSKTCASFLNLSVEELSQLVFSDHVVATEEEVFEGIVRWVRVDYLGRQSFVSELLPAIRVSRSSLRFLKQTLKHLLVQDQDVFRTSALERIEVLTNGGLGGDCFATQDLHRAGARDILFVMGGYYDVDTVETLDPAVGSWVSHDVSDAPCGQTWIGSWGHKVLVLELTNKRFRSLDVPTGEWTQLRYLPQHRNYYSVAVSSHQVYVLGGDRPHGTRCNRYDARTDRWDETAPMRQGRRGAASVCHAGKIYCSGGFSELENCALSILEVLNPRENGLWVSLVPMGVGRVWHCLVSCGSFLWAIAGYDGKTDLSDIEKYDVEGQQWSRVRPLHTPRLAFSVCVVGRRVHVIGGLTTESTTVRTVEVYDEEEDHWVSAALLPEERRWHGSCVVRSLPDADADQFSVPIK